MSTKWALKYEIANMIDHVVSACVNYRFDVLVEHMNELIVDAKGDTHKINRKCMTIKEAFTQE